LLLLNSFSVIQIFWLIYILSDLNNIFHNRMRMRMLLFSVFIRYWSRFW